MAPLPEFNISNADYLERLYAAYLRDASSVPEEWREYFQRDAGGDAASPRLGPSFHRRSIFNPANGAPEGDEPLRLARFQERVDMLVRNFRVRGHVVARFNPLEQDRGEHPELDPNFHGLTEEDLDRRFSTSAIDGADVRTLRELLEVLHDTYCRDIGVQFMHIDSLSVRRWLQQRMEGSQNRIVIPRDEQLRILTRLTDAVIFEDFIRKKYVGAKSFSLEGAESLIPLLDLALEHSAEQGVREVVMGMAHRGRLNVLANILGKSPKQIFREFEDVDPQQHKGRGDVKYHLGYSCDWKTQRGQNVHVSLCFNPSHLEFVNPVALGRMRAKQDRFGDAYHEQGMVVLIHGDAAFAGEGIVQESLNLSQLPAYSVGGTLHIIVNNQIGFTTPPAECRSATYATDVAKMLQSPIFHVNGESPEAVAQVVKLALEFRKTFERDVVIDMYCYRRWGHNEGDEPSFTQPQLYDRIANRASTRDGYLEHLLELGEVTSDEADEIAEQRRQHLEGALSQAREKIFRHEFNTLEGVWRGYHGGQEEHGDDVDTGVQQQRLSWMLNRLTEVPVDFHLHRKLQKAMEQRREMAADAQPLDWSAAEALAFGTLATEGYRVRMSGQDCQRGTFSQRHSVLHDTEDGHTYMPLANLSEDQAPIEIHNSPLSEAGVMGFEYGYSLDYPDALVVWEAQFGDFVNAGQVIIDQFIASAEDKWLRLSGITLLLPHGFEGQGPEHSSARLERFLVLAAEDNIQVAVPSTPAQYFHLLRRQAVRRWRKPLVVITPKSLLRNPQCVSPLADCAQGRFQRVLPDDLDPSGVKRILLCSGKVYYDLLAGREEQQRDDVAIVRLEQLYPLPEAMLNEVLEDYADETPVFWVQEEPANMAAWYFLRAHWCERLLKRFPFDGITRAASASPATGSHSSHKLEQENLIRRALGD